MALFQKKQFEELAGEKGEYCISIYIPTERQGENKESVIHLKNEIAKVQKQLSGFGLKQKEIDEYLDPVKKIQEDVNIWRHLSDSLVIFRNKNRMEHYVLPMKGLQSFSQVADRFYLLPLINIFNEDNRFFILSLSLKSNKLYEATQYEISEIETGDAFPETMYDSAGHDVVQKSLQMRGEQTGPEGYAMYHGQGEGKDDKKVEVKKYLEDVDRGLKEVLNDYDTPLVVAAVDNVF
ncbi:MAG TPA: hypothetical protein VKA10_00715, partial [Prolixibacteraceae bacterium]|nr:hypothetical protein [Prolixibacteraceae bacterium]